MEYRIEQLTSNIKYAPFVPRTCNTMKIERKRKRNYIYCFVVQLCYFDLGVGIGHRYMSKCRT